MYMHLGCASAKGLSAPWSLGCHSVIQFPLKMPPPPHNIFRLVTLYPNMLNSKLRKHEVFSTHQNHCCVVLHTKKNLLIHTFFTQFLVVRIKRDPPVGNIRTQLEKRMNPPLMFQMESLSLWPSSPVSLSLSFSLSLSLCLSSHYIGNFAPLAMTSWRFVICDGYATVRLLQHRGSIFWWQFFRK